MKSKVTMTILGLALLNFGSNAFCADNSHTAAPAGSADLAVNPFTGTSMSYEQMLEKQRNLDMALKVKKSELELAKAQAQIDLVPYTKKQNIRELEKKETTPGFSSASMSMPNVSPMPFQTEPRKSKKKSMQKVTESLKMPAMIPPVPQQPKVGAVIRDGGILSAVVTINGESRAVKTGDNIAGYQVLSVSDKQVVLQGGPAGSLFLPVNKHIGRIDVAVPVKAKEGNGVQMGALNAGPQPPTNAQLAQSLMLPPGVKPIHSPMPGSI